MTKKFCKQCGNALTKAGAKFCATCGATLDGAELIDITNQETVALPGEQKDQGAFATEVIQAITPISYATEEMPKPVITARAEEKATEVIEVIATTPATRPLQQAAEPAQISQSSAQQPGKKSEKKSGKKSEKKSVEKSAGQKKVALAAAFGVVAVVVVVAATFFVNSRSATDAQTGTQPAGAASPSTSAQPIAPQSNPQSNPQLSQPSGAAANNQAQSQTKPQPGPSISNVKSPAGQNDAATSKPQQQAVANPTPAAPKLSAEDHKQQGNTYLNSGRLQEALVEYENFRKLDPGNKDYYYLVGSAYQKMNQLQQALDSYRQCTSGVYANIAQNAVKNLEKKLKVGAK
jgi:cytochrome c-type biogenesis protein CcmH/NrfG